MHRDAVRLPIDFIARFPEIVVIVHIGRFGNETHISFVRIPRFRIGEQIAEIINGTVSDARHCFRIGRFGRHRDIPVQRDDIGFRNIHHASLIGRKRNISARRKKKRPIDDIAICRLQGNISGDAHVFRHIGDGLAGDLEFPVRINIGILRPKSRRHIPVSIHGDVVRIEIVDVERSVGAVFE